MLESANTPPNEDSAAPPAGDEDRQPTNRNDKIDEVAKILRGDEGKPEDDQGNQDDQGEPPTGKNEDSPKPVKPESLEAAAEALGIEVKDLYDIAIKQAPGPDGEDRSTTIGELADLAKDVAQFELDRNDLAETRQKQEAKFMRAQQELNELISMLPKAALSQDLLQAVAKKVTDSQVKERELTLSVISEWADEATEAADRKAMTKSLTEYGFPPEYLDSVQDHRTLKYIRDNWQRQQRMERALEVMRRRTPKSHKPNASGGTHKVQETKVTPTKGPKGRQQKVAAVADVLRQANEG